MEKENKICSLCNESYPATLEFFSRASVKRNGKIWVGLKSRCTYCRRGYNKIYDQENKSARTEYRKQRYLKLTDEQREKNRQSSNNWKRNNREHCNNYRNQLRKASPEKAREAVKKWKKRNPDSVRAHNWKRKAQKKNAEGKFTQFDINELFKEQNGLCAYCEAILNEFHIDHKIPLVRGGTNYPSNLALTCPSCNMSKHTKTDEEFRAYLAKSRDNASARFSAI